ncbi:MAG TPA: CoA transferase [Dehalococcoidia bacterium]|nr:CoA transferase [Dehalococcoidia bacterium]
MKDSTQTNTSSNHTALSGCRVLDLTTPLGHLCGKILGDLGADVIKIEPPAGDAGRARLPIYKDPTGERHSVFWLAYNNNKRGITLNLETASGKELFQRMAQSADVILESYPPGYMGSLGLDYGKLSASNQKLVYTAITPFGQTGPYCEFRAEDLEIQALSGVMSLTGYAGKAPLRISLSQSEAWASLYGAMGTMTAYHHRQRSGEGQFVDVSAQSACVIECAHAPFFWDYNRELSTREGEFMTGRTITGARFRTVWPCQDGYLTFIIYGGPAGRHTNRELVKWMDEHGMATHWLKAKDWDDFDIATVTQEEIDQIEEPAADFFKTLTKAEFFQRVLDREMLGYPLATAEDILADQQLQERGFWQELEHTELGQRISYPGPFAQFSAGGCGLRLRAPLIGEHNEEIYVGELGLSKEELVSLKEAGVV